VQFHELVLMLSNSRRAHQLYDSYVKELHLYRRQNFNAPGNMRRSNVEHHRLYEAISRGHAAKAKQYAEEHIQAGRQRLLALADEQ
jgi:DNA-binding FadR family transcriptional regulator